MRVAIQAADHNSYCTEFDTTATVRAHKVTALHDAAHKNFVGAIQMLADHGANLTAVSQGRGTFERSNELKGNTVRDWAYDVQTGGEAAVFHPEAVALVEKPKKERNLPLIRFEHTDGGVTAAAR